MLILILAISPAVTAAFPQPAGYVNDFANVLNSSSEAKITAIAESLAENQGIELAVVTLSNINDQHLEDYAVDLFAEWGIGGPEDSGILILLVIETREIRVETGYGIETVLPAGKVGRILDQFVIPHLRNNDYNTALVEAAKAYQDALTGASFALDRDQDDSSNLRSFLIFVAIAIIISIMTRKHPPTSTTGTGSHGRLPRTIIHPTRPPRSGGGGRSGGGFGGFGGGRSGGGGASRRF